MTVSDVGRCPECSQPIFEVVPQQITWRTIEEFLRSARFDGAAEALQERWIHPGGYCSTHGCVVLADYGVPDLRDEHEYRVFLVGCGARRKDVILALRRSLGIPLVEAQSLVKSPRSRLASGSLGEISELVEGLEMLGAELEIEQCDSDSGELVQTFRSLPAQFSLLGRTQKSGSGLELRSIVDDEGNVTGLMDGLTAAYLESEAPNPTQLTLDEMLAGVTRVRVIDDGAAEGAALGNEVLLASADPESIESLRECLAIVEDPESFGHCMCLGDLAIEFYGRQRPAATIGLHHGVSIRWDAWKHDAQLRDGAKILNWLAERGVTGPREEMEADRRRAEETMKAIDAWREATPPCLIPLWDVMMGAPLDIGPLQRALEDEYPDAHARILELFRWFGSGEGRWNEYPSYEGVPEKLLWEYPTAVLVGALTKNLATLEQAEGAARYFGGWRFRKERCEFYLIPAGLKQQLLEHTLEHSDPGNARAAQRAFGD